MHINHYRIRTLCIKSTTKYERFTCKAYKIQNSTCIPFHVVLLCAKSPHPQPRILIVLTAVQYSGVCSLFHKLRVPCAKRTSTEDRRFEASFCFGTLRRISRRNSLKRLCVDISKVNDSVCFRGHVVQDTDFVQDNESKSKSSYDLVRRNPDP